MFPSLEEKKLLGMLEHVNLKMNPAFGKLNAAVYG